MARHTSSSDSESDAPEAFSFSASKKRAQGETHAVQQFHSEAKRKLKERRRDRDQALKEQKRRAREERSAQNDEEEDGTDDAPEDLQTQSPSKSELETRMHRAMQEAQEEDEDPTETDEDEARLAPVHERELHTSRPKAWRSGLQTDETIDWEEEDTETDEPNLPPSSAKRATNDEESEEDEEDEDTLMKEGYLPDHLFKAAFSQSASEPSASHQKSKVRPKSKSGDSSTLVKKRRRVKKTAKDIVVGGRTIRTLQSHTQGRTAAALPNSLAAPAKANQFVSRSLNLRGDSANAKTKGWERRSANLGVMKRLGPAAHFARS